MISKKNKEAVDIDREESRKKLQFLLENSKKKPPQQDETKDRIIVINLENIKKITLLSGENLLVEFDESSKLGLQIITDEQIAKNQELQKIKNYLQKENKKSIDRQEIKTIINYNVKNSVETSSETSTLIIIGGLVFMVALVFALGYWLSRKDLKKHK